MKYWLTNLLVLLVEHGDDENEYGRNATLAHAYDKALAFKLLTHRSIRENIPSRNRSAKNALNEVVTACNIKMIPHTTTFTPVPSVQIERQYMTGLNCVPRYFATRSF